jgi:hypothetical protein
MYHEHTECLLEAILESLEAPKIHAPSAGRASLMAFDQK